MVKYDKSSIYKICCKDVNITGEYVGSTTNIQRRKTEHKHHCINDKSEKYNHPVYSYIRENGGWENFDFIEVEKFNATDKNHLHTRERYWIELLKSELNCQIPMRTNKEWKEDNKEHIVEYKKKYAKDNREHIVEYKKKYAEDNREHIVETTKKYREDNKELIAEKLKKYYENNKEQICESAKKYRDDNKEKIKKYKEENKERFNEKRNENNKEKVTCQCGIEMNKGSLTKHLKTLKHIAYIQSIQL